MQHIDRQVYAIYTVFNICFIYDNPERANFNLLQFLLRIPTLKEYKN